MIMVKKKPTKPINHEVNHNTHLIGIVPLQLKHGALIVKNPRDPLSCGENSQNITFYHYRNGLCYLSSLYLYHLAPHKRAPVTKTLPKTKLLL